MIREYAAVHEEFPDTVSLAPVFYKLLSGHVAYATYQGSLTTPGCNEAVTWVNFLQPVPVITEQFYSLLGFLDSGGHEISENYRYTQPLNGRRIRIPSSAGAVEVA